MQSGEILFLGNGPANPFRIVGDAAWILLLIYTATAFLRFGKGLAVWIECISDFGAIAPLYVCFLAIVSNIELSPPLF